MLNRQRMYAYVKSPDSTTVMYEIIVSYVLSFSVGFLHAAVMISAFLFI